MKSIKRRKKKELQYSSCSWWHPENNAKQEQWFSRTRELKNRILRGSLLQRFWRSLSGLSHWSSKISGQIIQINSEHNISHISKTLQPKTSSGSCPLWSLQGPRICRMRHLWSQPLWLQRFHQAETYTEAREVSEAPIWQRWLMGLSHWHPSKGAKIYSCSRSQPS